MQKLGHNLDSIATLYTEHHLSLCWSHQNLNRFISVANEAVQLVHRACGDDYASLFWNRVEQCPMMNGQTEAVSSGHGELAAFQFQLNPGQYRTRLLRSGGEGNSGDGRFQNYRVYLSRNAIINEYKSAGAIDKWNNRCALAGMPLARGGRQLMRRLTDW